MMNKTRLRRLYLVLAAVVVLGAAVAAALAAMNQHLDYFRSPSDVHEGNFEPGRRMRTGGLVVTGSIKLLDGLKRRFCVTDGVHQLPIVYDGILPDLFREGQGIVANGILGDDGVFVARQVLAKHDETYMPPEVAHALKQQGAGPLAEHPQLVPIHANDECLP